MARRRHGVPMQAVGAGDVWRQQQRTAALAAALLQLPAGDSLPLVLLRGLQRALACTQHTLHGLPLAADEVAFVASISGTATEALETATADVVKSTGIAQEVPSRKTTQAVRDAGMELIESVGSCESSQEQVAIQRAADILQSTLLTTAAMGSGGIWDNILYRTALLHSYLALSSDLFDASSPELSVATSSTDTDAAAVARTGGYNGLRFAFWRDDLAAVSIWRLPVNLYVHIVERMRWEVHLVELLAWVPDTKVVLNAMTRVLELCPALAPGLAAGILDGAAAPLQSFEAGGALASTSAQRRMVIGPSALLSRLNCSPQILMLFAGAVRRATVEEEEGGRGREGCLWLPCLLLLAGALVDVLNRAHAVVAAAKLKQQPAGFDSAWADECCEALQAGLCVWQGSILAFVSVAPTVEAAAPDAVVSARVGSVSASSDVVAAALLQLLQGQLRALLDDHAGAFDGGGGGATTGSGAEASQAPGLLSHNSVVRLRTRIILLGMQTEMLSMGNTTCAKPCPFLTADRVADDSSQLDGGVLTGSCLELKPSDVWPDLDVDRSHKSMASNLGEVQGVGPAVVSVAQVEAAGGMKGKGPPTSSLRASPPSAAVAGSSAGGSVWVPPRKQSRPCWLQAATARVATSTASVASSQTSMSYNDVMRLLGISQSLLPPQQQQQQPLPPPAKGSVMHAGAMMEAAVHVAAIAVALLTPGVGSWLCIERDPRVAAAAGTDSYSPFRMALALLELLQGRQQQYSDAAALASMDPVTETELAPGDVGSWYRSATTDRQEQQLHLRVMRMAVECLGCVGAPEQQVALQQAFLTLDEFHSLRARLATDDALQAAAGRALVALSNRAAAVEGSLDRLALSAQQEAQRLAAAATDMLPYAVLVPETCVRRLVLDSLTHPGQQPWVLQLLLCFHVAVAAPPPPSVLLSCLQDVLVPRMDNVETEEEGQYRAEAGASRWVRTAADRRSLLALLSGLMRAGLVAPRQLLTEVVAPGLYRCPRAGVRHGAVPRAHCALLVAQLVLGAPGGGGGGGEDSTAPGLYGLRSPASELAGAQPARLLLAVAGVLQELYDAYDGGDCSGVSRRLESAVIDVGVAVLERGVYLYGSYLHAEGVGSSELDDVRELSKGCSQLPRRLVAMLLPLLEMEATSVIPSSRSPINVGANGADANTDSEGEDAAGVQIRALVAALAPAGTWRPRNLRTADARFARGVLYDTFTYAASSISHAYAVRQALLEAEADAATEDGGDGGGGFSALTPSVWSTWGMEGINLEGVATLAAAPLDGMVARHVAATAARGLPQLPTARLHEGCVAALATILPTATTEQARRMLLTVLPSLIQATGGAAALHDAVMTATAAVTSPQGASASAEVGRLAGDEAGAVTLEILAEWLLSAQLQPHCASASATAAAVAMSMILACRAAVSGLQGAKTQETPVSILSATADRYAAHLALLASRLSVAADAAAAEAMMPMAQMRRTVTAAIEKADSAPSDPYSTRLGNASLEVAGVAAVLLAEMCGVAATAVALAPAGNERALDVWQAILLSVLKCLVTSLASWGAMETPPYPVAGVPGDVCRASNASTNQPPTASKANPQDRTAAVTSVWLLRSARRALCVLPGPAAEMLWGSLERLCEEYEAPARSHRAPTDLGVGDGCGWLYAAWLSAGPGVQ